MQWRSTRGEPNGHKIHTKTLLPEDQFYKDELIRHPRGYGNLKNSIERQKEQEDERQSINDVVALFDFPW